MFKLRETSFRRTMSKPGSEGGPLVTHATCPMDNRKRRAKLLRPHVNWSGPLIDFALGAGPWLVSVGIVATGLTAVIESHDGLGEWMRENLSNDSALSALGSMLSFLVVTRISDNLNTNAKVLSLFGSLCGNTVALAINVRGLANVVRDDRRCSSKLGLCIASLPYAAYFQSAKYDESDVVCDIGHRNYPALPIMDNPATYDEFKRIRDEANRGGLAMPLFHTMLLQITKNIHNMAEESVVKEENTHLKQSHVSTVMRCLNRVAEAEGNLHSTLNFQWPRIIDIVIYALFVLYYFLLLISTLIPQSSWSSIWVSMIIVLSTAGLYGISARLSNPFLDRAGGQNQRSSARRKVTSTERYVVQVMNASF